MIKKQPLEKAVAQTVDKVCLLNELMYINEKYTSAYFYVIIAGKEKFIFYEFDKLVFIEFAYL